MNYRQLTTLCGLDPLPLRLGAKVEPLDQPSPEDFRRMDVENFEHGDHQLAFDEDAADEAATAGIERQGLYALDDAYDTAFIAVGRDVTEGSLCEVLRQAMGDYGAGFSDPLRQIKSMPELWEFALESLKKLAQPKGTATFDEVRLAFRTADERVGRTRAYGALTDALFAVGKRKVPECTPDQLATLVKALDALT